MSFGFSVGDFLAALKLMSEAVSSLGDAHGAASEYQALRRSLDCVSLAVQKTINPSRPNAEAVKATAFACQYLIVQFLERTKKYQKSLDVDCSSGFWLKDSVRKINWALTKKEDVRKLKEDLNLLLHTVGILSIEDRIDELQRNGSENASQICRKVEQTTNAISAMGVDLEAQTVAVRETHSRLAQVMIIVSNELAQPIKSIFYQNLRALHYHGASPHRGSRFARVCLANRHKIYLGPGSGEVRGRPWSSLPNTLGVFFWDSQGDYRTAFQECPRVILRQARPIRGVQRQETTRVSLGCGRRAALAWNAAHDGRPHPGQEAEKRAEFLPNHVMWIKKYVCLAWRKKTMVCPIFCVVLTLFYISCSSTYWNV